MFRCVVLPLLFALGQAERKPMYKYRYETEDVMKTAASSVPVHGYHVVEGGYYPEAGVGRLSNFGGYGGGFGSGLGYQGAGLGYQGGGLGYQGAGLGYSGAGFGYGGPFVGGGFHHGGYGGEYIDSNHYGGGKKHLNDESYEHAGGSSHEQGSQGKEGYKKGQIALKNNKGDSGYYSGQEGGKKIEEDGKSYNGGQHYKQEGKNADEKKQQSGHKKGHVIKGFKTSHHKDESGKTEEYFDEANDEGGNYNFNGRSGAFGENAQSSIKGGHENGKFNAEQSKKEGHYDNHHIVDNSNADQGQYGEKKSYGGGKSYGVNNGIGEQSLLGHQENSRIYKHHIPFYPQY